MKKISQVFSIIIICAAVYYSFYVLLPGVSNVTTASKSAFSVEKAMNHVKYISQEQHFVGTNAHVRVQNYLRAELEKLGLQSYLQRGYTAGDWANLSMANNVLARIPGKKNGKALVLLSHYDSSPHSSYGASDAGSGVATILEGLRVFLEQGKEPDNDIIVMFSDAEELGLNGAQLFVNNHTWIKDVGLVLNFEARGSGGPSYMLVETNEGNAGMIHEFIRANPDYPVGNSFMYSIYKMLPNDTDLTVFREDADLNGFNFAFIDDHFDYHTQLDVADRLDPETLAHQGSYLMPLLNHFAFADLANVKSADDLVYFNVPLFKLISYPFGLIIPMLVIAFIAFIVILIRGKRKRVISYKGALKGFVPFLIMLVVNGLLGYFLWPVAKSVYPGFQDILHGFSYNGYWYIWVVVFFSISVSFLSYSFFPKLKNNDLAVAPLFFWLVLTAGLSIYLKGGAFFVIPLYCSLIIWVLSINQKRSGFVIYSLIALPILFILTPFVQMFPVGLGLKMLVASSVFVSLIFGLLIILFANYQRKKILAALSFVMGMVFLVVSHNNASFTEATPKPSSLVYVKDMITNTNYWATYDKELTPWVAKYLMTDKQDVGDFKEKLSSKYHTGFTHTNKTAYQPEIKVPETEVVLDTLVNEYRILKIKIAPKRLVNRLELFADMVNFESVSVNGVMLDANFLSSRKPNSKLVTHYISYNSPTVIHMVLPSDQKLNLTLVEASNDLLTNRKFVIPTRPKTEMPMPFVLNDAIIVKQQLRF